MYCTIVHSGYHVFICVCRLCVQLSVSPHVPRLIFFIQLRSAFVLPVELFKVTETAWLLHFPPLH